MDFSRLVEPHQFRTRNDGIEAQQTHPNANKNTGKSTAATFIQPLIMGWLQVRVLPGPSMGVSVVRHEAGRLPTNGNKCIGAFQRGRLGSRSRRTWVTMMTGCSPCSTCSRPPSPWRNALVAGADDQGAPAGGPGDASQHPEAGGRAGPPRTTRVPIMSIRLHTPDLTVNATARRTRCHKPASRTLAISQTPITTRQLREPLRNSESEYLTRG
jgi:hypothetical protein